MHTMVDFVQAVVRRKNVRPNFEDGLRNQRVLEAVSRSATTLKWVRVTP